MRSTFPRLLLPRARATTAVRVSAITHGVSRMSFDGVYGSVIRGFVTLGDLVGSSAADARR